MDKNLKAGVFAVSFVDETVALKGLPLQIVRSYDSRDPGTSDFGPGWSLSMQNVRVEKSAILGKFWEETKEGYFAFPTYCLKPTRPAIVTVTFPTGKVYRFQGGIEIQPGNSSSCQPHVPVETPTYIFNPLPGRWGRWRWLTANRW